jgi:hypothetical protein
VALRNALAGFTMAILPVAFFVLAAIGAIELRTAFDIAQWTGVAVLGGYALMANLRAGFPLGRSLLIGLGFTLLGAALVVLKIVL